MSKFLSSVSALLSGSPFDYYSRSCEGVAYYWGAYSVVSYATVYSEAAEVIYSTGYELGVLCLDYFFFSIAAIVLAIASWYSGLLVSTYLA